MDESRCYCGSGDSYVSCCGPIVSGAVKARTAEQLMRSRYSAYVVGDEAHIMRTWHPDHCHQFTDFGDGPEWLSLEVLAHTMGGPLDETGTVEFVATYRGGVRREVSRFARWQGAWVYLDDVG